MPSVHKICLLTVSCLVGLLLCEGSLRFFYPKYAPLAEARYRFDTLRIWARTANERAEYPHPDTRSIHALHHNNLGLRQHRNFSAADLAAATNIGIFGDSYVENIRMDAPYSLTEPLDYLLNQSGRRFNVLNFGVDGYGTGQSLLHYEHFRYADALAHVFYVYCDNDLDNLAGTGLFHLDEAGRLVQHDAIRTSWWATRMSRLHLPYLILDATGRLSSYVNKRAGDEKLKRKRLQWAHQERTAKVRSRRQRLTGAEKDEDLKERLAIFRRLIRRWKQAAERNGSKFYVVLLPKHNPAASPRVPDLLQEEDVATISLYDCFNTHDTAHYQRPWVGSPYRFKSDGHWNEAGNRLAARCLYRVLEKEMRLPALAEATLQATLRRYYAAFGGESNETLVSSPTTAGIRERYQAFKLNNEMRVSFSTLAAVQERYQALYALSIPMSALAEPKGTRILRSVFDVYLGDKSLIYHKQDCRLGDVLAPFFLHITPVDETDLPEDRLQYGYDNWGFRAWSLYVDNKKKTCAVKARFPDYPVRRIRTGQFLDLTESLWEGEAFIDPHPIRQD